MFSVDDILIGARFLRRLPGFLRHPVTIEEARAILRRRLERRETDFLNLVRRAIYEYPLSPYRVLLGLAGCEYGDLERLVRQEGVEGALLSLLRAGVYLTVDEFKGRRPVIRGSTTLAIDSERLRNPRSSVHLATHTSGSRSAATTVLHDFSSIRDRAVNTCLTLHARGGLEWVKAIWAVPGNAALVLRYGCFGAPPARWFSPVACTAPGLHPRYRWGARALRWGSLLAGVPLPACQYVPFDDPLPIVRWLMEILRNGRIPHLWAFPSAAVRACRAALNAKIELHGAQFTITGEPVTAARLAVIRQAGAEAVPDYGSGEAGGFTSYGCLAPEAPDEVHFFHDLHAVIQPGDFRVPSLPPRTLCVSSLRLTSPFILLNASMGDHAIMVRRTCGCPLDQLGWTSHLHTIRSFEKLTAAGMTFLDTDVAYVLEETLPRRFGGGPTDYQLVEEESEDGQPRLRLLVHPRLGRVDSEAVAEAFLSAISMGSGVERVMGILWRDARLLRVERRAPLSTPSGKILHLHAGKR